MLTCLLRFNTQPVFRFGYLKNCMLWLIPFRTLSVGVTSSHPDTKARVLFATWLIGLLLLPGAGYAQQAVTFQVDGKTYQAAVTWAVKHAGSEYKGNAAHTIDRKKDAAFDLEVSFRFRNDSVPSDNNVVWGFQFRQGGEIIAPAGSEKRSRSFRQFQRFQVSGTGNATLTISPKVWKKSAAGLFEIVGQSAPVTLGFSVTDGVAPAPVANTTTPSKPTANTPSPAKPNPAISAAQQQETQAYTKALSEPDSSLRTKALLNFIDQYGASDTRSALVAKALKEVPLGASLPQNKGGGTFSYTFNYAVRPFVDTANVQGWKWELSEFEYGRYRLTLNDLGDSVHAITIADLGKNAPYNRPRALRPFEKIRVTLSEETRDSFRIQVSGGIPPFIVYLSQNNVPKMRYTLSDTDTTWTFSKASCQTCKDGPHTLEVYSHDFSTLLLRAEGGVHIHKIDLYFLALYSTLAVLILFFAYKPIRRAWQHYLYSRKLRDIETWEQKVQEEEQRRRKGNNH